MATTILSRTPSVGGDRDKWTFSTWVKRCKQLANESIFGALSDGNNHTQIFWRDSNLEFTQKDGGSVTALLQTTRLFRDPGAWYHLVFVWDSANASAGDRMKIYVNGVEETEFNSDTNPALNLDSFINSTSYLHEIGGIDSSEYFSGVMAHTHFCDGQAYAASDFGETDATSGIWIAKSSPSVTYGNNGFFLKYQDTAAFGDDSSGNNNDMTMSATITQTKDTPDNNFCTMNSLENYYANQTFTQGNNTIKSDHPAPAVGTIGLTSGKWYWEGKAIVSTSGNDWQFGINGNQVEATSDDIGNHANDYGYRGVDGDIRRNSSNNSYGDSYTAGDIIGCAVDLTNNKLYFSKNGVWQDSGDPTSGATGTGAFSIVTAAVDTPLGYFAPSAGANASANDYTWSMNFGNGYFGTTAVASANADDAGLGSFEYDVPAGYYAICTTNLGDQS